MHEYLAVIVTGSLAVDRVVSFPTLAQAERYERGFYSLPSSATDDEVCAVADDSELRCSVIRPCDITPSI